MPPDGERREPNEHGQRPGKRAHGKGLKLVCWWGLTWHSRGPLVKDLSPVIWNLSNKTTETGYRMARKGGGGALYTVASFKVADS